LSDSTAELQRITNVCEMSNEFNNALNFICLHMARNELYFEEKNIRRFFYNKLVGTRMELIKEHLAVLENRKSTGIKKRAHKKSA
jgi:hypothetical protein